MIYMVEMNLMEMDRRVEWDAWYVSHMRMLITIPGIHATQRFECLHDHPSPFVALHEVDGPEVFASDAYKATAGPFGTGEWRTKMNNWNRNVFDGLDQTPDVPEGSRLLVVEDGAEASVPAGLSVNWLTSVGLDKSVSRRGVVVCSVDQARPLEAGVPGIRVLKPLTSRLVEAA